LAVALMLGASRMDTMPVIDSGNVAQVALTRILETASVPVTMRQGAECSRSLWTTGLWTGLERAGKTP